MRRTHANLVISALAFAGSLAFVSAVYASPGGAADIPQMTTAAQPRSVEQQIKLANDYFVGRGVTQDFTLSAHWFEKAAEQGDSDALFNLGMIYERSDIMAPDLVRSFSYFKQAAEKGLARAQYEVACAYQTGKGTEQSISAAKTWFEKAAKQGVRKAIRNLQDLTSCG